MKPRPRFVRGHDSGPYFRRRQPGESRRSSKRANGHEQSAVSTVKPVASTQPFLLGDVSRFARSFVCQPNFSLILTTLGHACRALQSFVSTALRCILQGRPR